MEYDEIVVTLIVVLSKGLMWKSPSKEFLLDLWNLIPEGASLRRNIFKVAVAAALSPPVHKQECQDGKVELTFEFGHRFEQPTGSPRPPIRTTYNFMQHEIWSMDHKKVIVNLSGQATTSRKPPDAISRKLATLWAELDPLGESSPLSV